MTFKKFVEVGRVAYARKGPAEGKLFAIIDIIDYNRVLVDGPNTGVPRQEYRLINLILTKYKINIQHGQHTKFVRKAWDAAKISERWSRSEWAKFVQLKEKRETLTDLDRFKVAYLKRAENRAMKLVSKLTLKRRGTLNRAKAIKAEKARVKKRTVVKKPLPQKVCKLYSKLRIKGVFKNKPQKPKVEKKKLRTERKKTAKFAELKKKRVLARKAKKEAEASKSKTEAKSGKAGGKPAPATKKLAPATKKPAPATKKPAPAAKKPVPAPATKKPAPAAKKPAPEAKKPAPAKKATSKKPAPPKPKKADAKPQAK